MFANLSRGMMLATLVVAPWLFGGATSAAQFNVAIGVALSVLFWAMSIVPMQESLKPAEPWSVPPVVICGALLLAFTAFQLIPVSFSDVHLDHAVLADWLETDGAWRTGPAPISVTPADTQTELARLGLGFSVLVLSSVLFSERTHRRLLFTVAIINGSAISLFGVIQKISWNGLLYWTVPLTKGGQPFASYVNRNNAAGYLNLCLACGFGLLLAAIAESLGQAHSQRSLRRLRKVRDKARFKVGGILVLMVLISIGVIASASRGGTLSLVAMGFASIWLATDSRSLKFTLSAIVGVTLISVGVLISLGLSSELGSRLSTLRHIEQLTDSRPLHWQDTLAGVQDFPWFGTGLGSYQYAHRPYQRHIFDGWYVNADSEYVEWLLEGGFIGFGLMALFVLATVTAVRRLLLPKFGPPVIDAGAALVMLLVSQLLQAATDFGITLAANQLLAAAIIGSAAGRATKRRDEKDTFNDRPATSYSNRRDWRLSAAGVVLLVGSSLASYELWDVMGRERFQVSLPVLSTPDESVLLQTSVALSDATSRRIDPTEDGEFHRSLGAIHLYRLRMQLFELLQSGLRTDASDLQVWRRTSPPALLEAVINLQDQSPDAVLPGLLPDASSLESLRLCLEHLHRANQAEPLLPGISERLACLDESVDIRQQVTRAAILSPADAEYLFSLGVTASIARSTDLACQCWQQSLSLRPERAGSRLKTAIELVGETRVLADVVPANSAPLLIEFAELSDGEQGRALTRAAGELKDDSATSDYLRGRIAELRNRPAEAMAYYFAAVEREPFNIEWRLKLATLYEGSGQTQEAIEQLTKIANMAPGRTDIRTRLLTLQRKVRKPASDE